MNKLLIIVGQTAVGKTAISLKLAREFEGEIVSADSRLFYRGMNIGTAKPSADDMQLVPHYLVDICDPDQTLTLGEYQQLAYLTIDQILERNRLPILVGGTGQYIMAVAEGWGIPEVAPRPSLRRLLEQLGGNELNRWLIALDPYAAQKIDSRNLRRVIRALEVTLTTGIPITKLQHKSPPSYERCWIGLFRDRESLYRRIDQRVDQMIDGGLVGEIQTLRLAGYDRSLPALSGLGYRQIFSHLEGECTLEEAVQRMKFETHRFSRQQNTWFRRDDPRINWFDLDQHDAIHNIIGYVRQWLDQNSSPD
ncbi:MAG: tRNA (adenosine(37)-N6)-dimethylallyltransferase MiaA [Candidatus Promineifilaceae bacterium]|nr:tRNA (adenosine(37)-N6)-dimethylallyltransferase MiaA [Candidatus Promineifilaceae bacterium]